MHPCPHHPVILLARGGICPRCLSYKRDQERHRSQRRRADRADRWHFYNSMPWRKLRAWFLQQHPLCAECQRSGRVAAAEQVDHVIPLAEGGAALDSANLQALCMSCHSAKTARELHRQGKFSGGRRY